MLDVSTIAVGVGIGIGIAALGVGIGEGIAAYAGLTGMSRQPESAGRIQTAMLIALAFVELVFLLTFVLMLMIGGKLPNYEESRAKGQLTSSISVQAPMPHAGHSNMPMGSH